MGKTSDVNCCPAVSGARRIIAIATANAVSFPIIYAISARYGESSAFKPCLNNGHRTVPVHNGAMLVPAHSGSLYKPTVAVRFIATGLDATPEPDSTASGETTPPVVSSDAPTLRPLDVRARTSDEISHSDRRGHKHS